MVRILAVVPKSPLPADNGSRQRFAHLLRALRRVGVIDLVATEPLPPELVGPLRSLVGGDVHAPSRPIRRGAGARQRMLRQRDLPLGLAALDPAAARDEAGAWVAARVAAEGPYDLVWYGAATCAWIHAGLGGGAPVALELADVAHVVADRRLAWARRAPDRWTVRGLKRIGRWAVDRRRLASFERTVAEAAELTTVCSDVDAAALGAARVVVVPNGYEVPARPVGRSEVGEPPTLLFCGQHTYEANEDGAVWFAEEILPLVRRQLPGTRLLLVGRASDAVEALAQVPGVEVRGYVDDVVPSLASADAVVVPLRIGGGTRIKILEALAHRVPVAATTIGAEGLDVRNGHELLLGDTPAELADACVRLLTDQRLRDRLADAGRALVEERYDWATIEAEAATRFAGLLPVPGVGR